VSPPRQALGDRHPPDQGMRIEKKTHFSGVCGR
jgi:hypothetical protein